jgi:hypothetical protein
MGAELGDTKCKKYLILLNWNYIIEKVSFNKSHIAAALHFIEEFVHLAFMLWILNRA